MVWWLAPTDSATPGPFYFTAPGIYTVGRKDCTITIQTDKTISRLHAEISVEAAPPLGPAEKDFDNLPRCKFLIKDLSKFGTFVNKETDSKPLNSLPDSIAVLKEGDVILFGNNKAVFRLQYVPIVLCMSPSTFGSTAEVRSKAEGVGAYVLKQWNSQCTHLLVEESTAVTDLVKVAVLSRKPVLSLEWLQALISQSSPRDQLPSLSRFLPTLKMDSRGAALPTPIAEPLVREETLAGYTVFIQKGCLYHNQDLSTLVDAAGGSVIFFTRHNLKDVAGSVQQPGLLVSPAEQASRKDWLGSKLLPSSAQHLHSMSEEHLLRCILTAKLDLSSVNISPAASVDTDETVKEEDPEEDVDSASSVPQENIQVADLRLLQPGQAFVGKVKESSAIQQPSAVVRASSAQQSQTTESTKYFEKASFVTSTLTDSLNKGLVRSQAVTEAFRKQPVDLVGAEHPPKAVAKSEAGPLLGDEFTAEVIFSGDLIAQKDWSGSPAAARRGTTPNFKRFKKGVAAYGNSFSSLVPFAKDPYRESDYGREMGDYMKQEKKRKEAELLSDDLFNAEQLKRRKAR